MSDGRGTGDESSMDVIIDKGALSLGLNHKIKAAHPAGNDGQQHRYRRHYPHQQRRHERKENLLYFPS